MSEVSHRGKQGGAGIRTDIQALRAVAVTLVVVFHVWPKFLPGGFVGVDVFFVISGFLITSLLLSEVESTGRIAIVAFWARRARRILPAALVTLAACAVMTMLVTEQSLWQQFLSDIRASALYVQNWHLAAQAVDYFAPKSPSPVSHFWSLSVEEQFYIVWPALMIAAIAIPRHRRPQILRRWVVMIVSGAVAASFLYSLHRTSADPAVSYFATPTRGWEFGVGGLLALAPVAIGGSSAIRAVLLWIGLAAIVVSAILFSSNTPFPGSAALLPVLGAVAVIYAGMPQNYWSPSRLMALRPLQYLGDISYSVYLWHLPIIVFLPFVVDLAAFPADAVIISLTLVLGGLSKRFIEDPFRKPRSAPRRLSWTFGVAGAATAACIALTAFGLTTVHSRIEKDVRATRAVLAHKPRCFGAAAHNPRLPCLNPDLRLKVVPTPEAAPKLDHSPCTFIKAVGVVHPCQFGLSKGAKATVALVGDSHAGHWRPALNVVAKARHWKGISVTHTSCPFSRAVREIVEPKRTECIDWNRGALNWFRHHPEIHTIFFVQEAGADFELSPGVTTQHQAQLSGYQRAWQALPRSVRNIVLIRDTPNVTDAALPCVDKALKRKQAAGPVCARRRSQALLPDQAVTAAKAFTQRRIQVIDMTSFLCDSTTCPPVIGGVLVYKDASHLTPAFSESLGPFLLQRVDRLSRSWGPT